MATYYGAGTAELLNFLGLTFADQTEIGLSETQMTDALARAQAEIKERTKTHFVDPSGTASPDYVAVADEKHDGQGKYDRAYYTIRYPLPNLSTQTSGTVGPGSTTVGVTSTSGFPASGVIGIGGNKITYTSKTGSAFTGATGFGGSVGSATAVLPTVVEISTDDQGVIPSWSVMTPDDEYDIDLQSGRIFIYKNWVVTSIYASNNPPKYTPDRVRFNYIYGWETIPTDITRLTLMIASRDLMQTIVRRAYMRGLNSFNPSMIDVSDALIEQTIGRYQNPMTGNTH